MSKAGGVPGASWLRWLTALLVVPGWVLVGQAIGTIFGLLLLQFAEGDPDGLRAAFFVVLGWGGALGSVLGGAAGLVHAASLVRVAGRARRAFAPSPDRPPRR